MKKLQVFTVHTFNCRTAQSMEVGILAHYMTPPMPGSSMPQVRFWVKLHWYSRRRCVGVFDWRVVAGVRNETPADRDWVREAGVKL